MKQTHIRPIEGPDFTRVCSLEQGSSECSYQAAVFVRQAMTLWPRTFLVAEMNNQFVGYLIGSITEQVPLCCWILRVRVSETFQRNGIATKLLQHIEDIMKEVGVLQIFLSCSPTNAGALALYNKKGYRNLRCETGYFGPGQDRLILEKNL